MKNFNTIFNQLTAMPKRLAMVLTVLFTIGVGSMWGAKETYEKVTSAPSDWSGEYLIVYEAGKIAFNGSLTTLDATSNTTAVTISNNQIELDSKYSFTIAKSGSNYTIKSASGKYIGNNSNSNALASSSSALNNTISFSKDEITIKSSGGAYLRYNATSGQTRFRYYKSSTYTDQKAICLYKKVASCTAPTSVSISGEWGYFAGETISLKATPTGGGTPTGYQWYKNGTAISGATSNTYSKSNCTDSDAGNYTCKVSTGATCSTTSSAFVLRVYSLQNYTGGTTTHNFTRVGTTKTGTVEVVLTNNKQYEFKIFAGNSLYLGNNGTISADISNWVFETGTNNVKLNSGLGGTFIFTIDYSSDSSKPKISVSYPRKTIYMNCGNTSWCDSDPAFFAHTWGNGDYDVKLTQHPCDETVYLVEDIPAYNSYIIFTRQKPGSTQLVWSGDNFWNQSEDITIGTNDLFTCTGWNNNKGTFSGGTYTPPTYTITFSGNGNTGGSMSKVTGIPCEGSTTLVGNGYTRTGYTFNNWKTNVAVTANSTSVAANGTVANKATISNITSDITLTAQWKANTYTITYKDGGNTSFSGDHESGYPTTHTYGTATTLKNATKTGYTFDGWYKESACTNKVTSLGANAYTANITLYAKWTPITYYVKFNANGGSGSMSNQTFTYETAQNLTANAFTRTGYTFAGWTTNDDGSGTSYADKASVNNLSITNGATVNLYAKWTKLYTVTFYNIGSSLETKTQETVGGSIACPTITAPCNGYEFVGWSETAVANNSTSYTNVSCPFTPTEDTELHAVYSKEAEGGGSQTVTLTNDDIDAAYVGSGDNKTTSYGNHTIVSASGTWGGRITIGNESSVIYVGISANDDNRHLASPIFSANITNITIRGRHNASKTRNVYICSSNTKAKPTSGDIGSGSIASSGVSNQYTNWTDVSIPVLGDYKNFYVYADGGLQIYSIVVTTSGGSTTTYTTTPNCCTPLDEITGLTFSAMTRSITVSVPENYDNTNVDGYIFNLYNAATGGVDKTYDTNDKNEKSHTFTGLTPDKEYYFTIIAKGSGAYCNSEEISPRESYTTLPQYTVTWSPAGGHWSGSTADKVDTYDYQAEITKPTDPERTGYTFNGWNTTPATIMPAENLTYTAQWNIVTYTITYENLNGASNSNPISYDVESETITLLDPGIRDGFAFGGWYSDADYTTSVTQISEGSTGNITLYAKWIAIYSVTWMVNGLEYTAGNPDTEVLDGDKVESLPTPPTPDEGNNIYCGDVFAGWTDKLIDGQTNTYPDPLFTTIEGSPEIKQNTTFYAVFADYDQQ